MDWFAGFEIKTAQGRRLYHSEHYALLCEVRNMLNFSLQGIYKIIQLQVLKSLDKINNKVLL
jgi:hypothetical protein